MNSKNWPSHRIQYLEIQVAQLCDLFNQLVDELNDYWDNNGWRYHVKRKTY